MSSIVNSITSHIPNPIPDSINPFASEEPIFSSHSKAADPATPTDLIWLLDNTAAQDPKEPDTWRVPMIAAFFGRNTGKVGQQLVSHVVGKLQDAGFIGGDPSTADEERKRVEHRVLPFFREIIEDRSAELRVRKVPPRNAANQEDGAAVAQREIGPSDANGVAKDDIIVNGRFTDGDLTRAGVAGGIPHVPAYTTMAAPEGWAVISDIDDTIKVTLTDHVAGILKSTFLDEPQPIEGMPELYWHINDALDNPPFWYLSASPYNLYEFLHKFRDTHYPRGTLELRNASWQNTMSFISSLSRGTKDYKVDKMEQAIYKYWPKRKFVCFGDSTQTDPEAYAEMARRHPEWIGKIFIRRVRNVIEAGDGVIPGRGDEERNKPERFEKAFEGLDKSLWFVFDTPAEVRQEFDAWVKSR